MDADHKKTTLRQISYGLYVVSSAAEDLVGADTVNWLSQASFGPPLVMVAIKTDSNLHAAAEKSGAFGVNFLSASQGELAQDFFRPTSIEGGLLNGHPFKLGATGSPVLDEVYAFLECRVSDKLALGDHTVFVGEVVEVEHRREDKPLEMWGTGWFYGG